MSRAREFVGRSLSGLLGLIMACLFAHGFFLSLARVPNKSLGRRLAWLGQLELFQVLLVFSVLVMLRYWLGSTVWIERALKRSRPCTALAVCCGILAILIFILVAVWNAYDYYDFG